jgi:hypothetical protein
MKVILREIKLKNLLLPFFIVTHNTPRQSNKSNPRAKSRIHHLKALDKQINYLKVLTLQHCRPFWRCLRVSGAGDEGRSHSPPMQSILNVTPSHEFHP